MKTFMNPIKILSVAALAFLVFANVAQADYLSTNQEMSTLQINDEPIYDNRDTVLYKLFNSYFTEHLGEAYKENYSSSNDLFAARGVKDFVTSWFVNENATIQAAFKVASYNHTLYLNDAQGNAAEIGYYPGNANPGEPGYGQTTINDNPMVIGESGLYTFSLDTEKNGKDNTFYSQDADMNGDNFIHMIAFDVTDLMRQVLDDMTIESAYLIGWEDMLSEDGADFDYQDLTYIMVNVTPVSYASTPEPATALILLCGVAGYPVLRRFRKRSA